MGALEIGAIVPRTPVDAFLERRERLHFPIGELSLGKKEMLEMSRALNNPFHQKTPLLVLHTSL